VASSALSAAPGHPFYRELNRLLDAAGFDRFAEERCARFYVAGVGRPSVPAGVYFRMLMVGYFEGLGSERGIAWRCADSRSLAEFLGYGPGETTPDHTTLSKTRQRLDLDCHSEVFGWALALLAEKDLVKGQCVGIDSSTLEANAAMRSLVHRETGQSYAAFLDDLAKSSGIAKPTREDRKKLDRKRKGKASNDDWQSPTDTDARITKMKDGRTHLAYKAEHAVDLDSGAIVGVTVQPADRGDSTSVYATLSEANDQLKEAAGRAAEEVVLDKGFHCDDVLATLTELDLRTYASEPKRPRRRWRGRQDVQRAVYNNRRRVHGRRGRELLRRRGELLERPFAHVLDTGGLRRAHVRGQDNVLKRLLIGDLAANLGLLMRTLYGAGTPKGLADRLARLVQRLAAALASRVAVRIAVAMQLVAQAAHAISSSRTPRTVAA
jgi:transposase